MQQKEEFWYKHMEVWNDGIAYSSLIISLTEGIAPHMRSKGVLAKIEKAAMNVPAKIAYGKAMGQSFGYLKALRQAEGNVHMLSSYLHLMRQLKWISASEFVQLEKEGLRLARKISSLIVILQILLENGN